MNRVRLSYRRAGLQLFIALKIAEGKTLGIAEEKLCTLYCRLLRRLGETFSYDNSLVEDC